MNRLLKIRIMTSIVCLLFAASFLSKPIPAGPTEPETMDYAEFRYDPYPEYTYTMKIHYYHESYCTMYIYLYNPKDSVVRTWTASPTQRSGDLNYTGAYMHGVWRLQCYMSGYQPYWTDAALLHTFGIADPTPPAQNQKNLGSDWARHPQNEDIYHKALAIIGQSTSSYEAAQKIYSHVLAHFPHDPSLGLSFRSDTQLLNDLNTHGHYIGVCRSDAVILTAYARALGIPARIIHLHGDFTVVGKPDDPPEPKDEHYFAEFYVKYAQYQWIPVDGDSIYDWFGLTQANQDISSIWPRNWYENGHLHGYWSIGISIVTQIPKENLEDTGFTFIPYPDPPDNKYQNDL